MTEMVENYGYVQITKIAKGFFHYGISQDLLSSRPGIEQIDFLLQDDMIEEIMFVGEKKPIKVYHQRYGMCNTDIMVSNNEALKLIMEVASTQNKVIADKSPLLDASMADGSRMNATIPPASADGPTFTIRKYKKTLLSPIDLIKGKVMSLDIAAFLWMCIEGLNARPSNMIFSGGTSSGKTTNLNALSLFIPFESRMITIEDVPEIKLMHEHNVRLVCAPNADIEMEDLLVNSLRMRPDRIIVGEVRSKEAKTLFSAMNTGHRGAMGTLHANSVKDTLIRITQEPMGVPPAMLNGLDLIIMQERMISGRKQMRSITEISEIISSVGGNELPKFNSLFKWSPQKNQCLKTGVPSRLRERIAKEAGMQIKEFDELQLQRKQLLDNATANNYDLAMFMNLVMENRF
jgi:flagellar protein FlaI